MEVQEVSVVGAVAFVFMASTMLLLLFFFLNRVFAIVLVCTAEQMSHYQSGYTFRNLVLGGYGGVLFCMLFCDLVGQSALHSAVAS